jgi:hypothetical protein
VMRSGFLLAVSVLTGLLVASSGAGVSERDTTCRFKALDGRCFYGFLSGTNTVRSNTDYDRVPASEKKPPCNLESEHTSVSDVVEYVSARRGPRVARFFAPIANKTYGRIDAEESFFATKGVFLTIDLTRHAQGSHIIGQGAETFCTPTTFPLDTSKCGSSPTGFATAAFGAYPGIKIGTSYLVLNAPVRFMEDSHCGGYFPNFAGANTSGAPGPGGKYFAFAPMFKRSKFIFKGQYTYKEPNTFSGRHVGDIVFTEQWKWTFCETGKIRPADCH